MAGNFELINMIGSGTYGEAWLAKSLKNDKKCVVKVIKILKLSEKELDRSLTEVSILARCNHPNIISYLDAYVKDGNLNIAMEYADGGDLHKNIVSQKGIHFGKEVIFDWFVQICLALKYIHSSNILHRDLKSQNIFLNSKRVIKLGDFGIARILRDSGDHALTTIGTPFYLSPEICQRKPYNHKSDMWAAGCVLYEMCCLRVPFNAPNFDSLVMIILQGKCDPIPRYFGATMEHLIHRLLNKDPDIRPTANEILCMPQLRSYTLRYEPGEGHKRFSVLPEDGHIPTANPQNDSSEVQQDKKEPKGETDKISVQKDGSVTDVSRGKVLECKQVIVGTTDVSVVKKKALSKGGHVKEAPRPGKKIPLARNHTHLALRKMSVNKVEEKQITSIPKQKSKERTQQAVKENTRKKKLSSDKENIDPGQVSSKTYAVKNPKFRHLSHAAPRICGIVSRQRAALSADLERTNQRSSKIKTLVDTDEKPGDSVDDMRTMIVKDVPDDNDDEVFQNTLSMSAEIPVLPSEPREQQEKRKSLGMQPNSWKTYIKGKQLPRRSTSCDNVVQSKSSGQKIGNRAMSDGNIQGNMRKVNEKTYLVSKLASKDGDSRLDKLPPSGKRTVAVFIAKTLFSAILDTQSTPSAAGGALYCHLVDVFGQQRAKALVECTSQCLTHQKDFSIIQQEFSDNELVYFPLVVQYLTLQNVTD
ncbi:serine/threonine-protein kinase Nek4-like [Pecten maximus]|uniref:serine/threonine-protein kinase Nek4-like n=1 Tax=Pecten maximus TaxID=6579 RepID=UPI001457EB31|nr:serine/threonine-protein kinase Nek4-like [Pecten maximus]